MRNRSIRYLLTLKGESFYIYTHFDVYNLYMQEVKEFEYEMSERQKRVLAFFAIFYASACLLVLVVLAHGETQVATSEVSPIKQYNHKLSISKPRVLSESVISSSKESGVIAVKFRAPGSLMVNKMISFEDGGGFYKTFDADGDQRFELRFSGVEAKTEKVTTDDHNVVIQMIENNGMIFVDGILGAKFNYEGGEPIGEVFSGASTDVPLEIRDKLLSPDELDN